MAGGRVRERSSPVRRSKCQCVIEDPSHLACPSSLLSRPSLSSHRRCRLLQRRSPNYPYFFVLTSFAKSKRPCFLPVFYRKCSTSRKSQIQYRPHSYSVLSAVFICLCLDLIPMDILRKSSTYTFVDLSMISRWFYGPLVAIT